MIKEIQAKVLLNRVPQPDHWFGLRYNMNLYRGCQHQCIYCDSRSECYQIENFADILVKVNAIELLRKELSRKRIKGTIGTGSMNDPYMPVERKVNLTGQALEVIARYKFPVHIITKSDLVLKDLDTLREINRVYAAVSFTITTADDDLAGKLEPGAPTSSARFEAMRALADNGILTGVTLMPLLPFIEDTEQNIIDIVTLAHENGASYIIPSFGMSLRDRQRDFYYDKLDSLFPGMRKRYERTFGSQYRVSARRSDFLYNLFADLCQQKGIETNIIPYSTKAGNQLSLF